MFDPVTKVWYKQFASGPIPSPRLRFCTAGVGDTRPVSGGSSTGTYEMYVSIYKAILAPIRKWCGSPGETHEKTRSFAAYCSASRVANELSLLFNYGFFSCGKKHLCYNYQFSAESGFWITSRLAMVETNGWIEPRVRHRLIDTV